ncbi:amino acid ABC transporter permease [Arthrobacter globiformis]|uniref:amino acid ABC transporter permease n=1 Tax=Arthrobacter globiformis TaxID=1665 RepID=UPI0027851C38|nr:amino acid ABC transporter permease [Arthrobacter globiformis]MDQ0864636.1 glutamate transport system permease protein [Arthrobacter globiformis]
MSGSGTTIRTLYDVPGPRAKALNILVSVLCVLGLAAAGWWVSSALAEKGQLAAEKWEPFVTPEMWLTYLLPGILGTLQAAAFAIVLAIILGILLGVGRLSENRTVRYSCGAVVEFFRAIPLLILMIFCFQLFADYALFPSTELAVAAVVTGLALSNGAVIAEIVRAGIKAIPRGQGEAAIALGLGNGQTLRMILLPQAITAMLPAIVAQLVVALKDTALGYQITYVEAVRQGIQAGSAYSNYIPALVVIALVMIAINLGLSRLATYFENRLRSGRKPALKPAVEEVVVPQT